MRLPIALVVLTAAIVAGWSAGVSSGAKAADRFTFSLNWTPLADHSPYYTAEATGLYEKANLQVKIRQGSGSGASVSRVGIGQADCGLADTPVIINAIRGGAHVKIVAMEFDHSPNAIWTTKSTGIRKPKDLIGKTVGAAPGDSERLLFPALAKANHIDPNSVHFVNIDPSAYYSALKAHRVDAIFDFTTGAPFVEQAVGKGNAVEIPWSSNGLDLYGLAIVCNQKFLSSHADVVKRFLGASYSGWQMAMKNPRQALEYERKYVPQTQISSYLVNFQLAVKLMCTRRYKAHGIGYIDPAKMKQTVRVVQKYMPASSNISDPSTIYSNSFLSKHDLPSCGALT